MENAIAIIYITPCMSPSILGAMVHQKIDQATITSSPPLCMDGQPIMDFFPVIVLINPEIDRFSGEKTTDEVVVISMELASDDLRGLGKPKYYPISSTVELLQLVALFRGKDFLRRAIVSKFSLLCFSVFLYFAL